MLQNKPLTCRIYNNVGLIKVVVNESHWNVDYTAAHVHSAIASSDITENQVLRLILHLRIIVSSYGYFVSSVVNPPDNGRTKQSIHWIGNTSKSCCLSTEIVRRELA